MYKVIKKFRDMQDGFRAYSVGDTFPHDGREISAERIAELAGSKNKRGEPLIKKVSTPRKKAVKKES